MNDDENPVGRRAGTLNELATKSIARPAVLNVASRPPKGSYRAPSLLSRIHTPTVVRKRTWPEPAHREQVSTRHSRIAPPMSAAIRTDLALGSRPARCPHDRRPRLRPHPRAGGPLPGPTAAHADATPNRCKWIRARACARTRGRCHRRSQRRGVARTEWMSGWNPAAADAQAATNRRKWVWRSAEIRSSADPLVRQP